MANEKRLIDANALILTLEKIAKEDETNFFHLDEITQEIFDANTVDAVGVVHGRWNEINQSTTGLPWKYRCDKCGCPQDYAHNYCPNCGAKMDGDGNG